MTLATRPATPAAPVEVVTPIKPSEAIRLGRLTRPEKGESYVFLGETMACAVGAMALGYGMPDPGNVSQERERHVRDTAYALVQGRLGLDANGISGVWCENDRAYDEGRDPDAAVLAYLAERGL